MRTTLEIDDDVLQAAKELGRSQRKTAGKVLSDLARAALSKSAATPGPVGPGGTVLEHGWHVFPASGQILTTETVKRLLDEADLDDAGIKTGE
jgi:hypothetical protein